MNMKAQILTATLFTSLAGVMSAAPADPMLLNLVMPDAKALAGVNVQQAKGTVFGQFILNQMQTTDTHLQELMTLTGFDPRRDVRELLVATAGDMKTPTGLALARGTFDVAKITGAAAQHGAVTEVYGSTTIIEDPEQKGGVAFPDSSTMVAGDIASVKGAIDRLTAAQPLPAALLVKINQWSNSEDAWAVSAVGPASLVPAGSGGPSQVSAILQSVQTVQQSAGGVKFGDNVVFSGEATCDTPQSAQTLGDLMRMIINIAQMQTGGNADAAAVLKGATITVNGNGLKVTASVPQSLFQQMLSPAKAEAAKQRLVPRK
jgi:hypothetical protein